MKKKGIKMEQKIKKPKTFETCPECRGRILTLNFERTCGHCGLVVNEIFGESSYMINEQDRKNNLYQQSVALGVKMDFIGGLGTFIDYEKSMYLKDRFGRLLPPNVQKNFKRLKKTYEPYSRIKNHETEYRIFNVLSKISLFLNLNKNISKIAAYHYRKILKKEGKVINNIALIAFCIFHAVRQENHNAPISIKEISEAFYNYGHRASPRLILRAGLRYKHHLAKDFKPHKSEDYIIRLIANIINHKDLEDRLINKGSEWTKEEFQMKLATKCQEILKILTFEIRRGRNPFILAGATIYLADKLLAKEFGQKAILTQKIISEGTKIAEYSIRDHYVNLLKPLFIKK